MCYLPLSWLAGGCITAGHRSRWLQTSYSSALPGMIADTTYASPVWPIFILHTLASVSVLWKGGIFDSILVLVL